MRNPIPRTKRNLPNSTPAKHTSSLSIFIQHCHPKRHTSSLPTVAAAEVTLIKPINPIITKLSRPTSRLSTLRPSFNVRATAAAAANPRPKKSAKTELKETLLAPRFYTTDFDEMEMLFNKEINKRLNQTEFEALLNEFKTDYNQTHFVRSKEFKEAADKMQGPLRQIFVEFLERSCAAQFWGFLLYRELGRRLKEHCSLLMRGRGLFGQSMDE